MYDTGHSTTSRRPSDLHHTSIQPRHRSQCIACITTPSDSRERGSIHSMLSSSYGHHATRDRTRHADWRTRRTTLDGRDMRTRSHARAHARTQTRRRLPLPLKHTPVTIQSFIQDAPSRHLHLHLRQRALGELAEQLVERLASGRRVAQHEVGLVARRARHPICHEGVARVG